MINFTSLTQLYIQEKKKTSVPPIMGQKGVRNSLEPISAIPYAIHLELRNEYYLNNTNK